MSSGDVTKAVGPVVAGLVLLGAVSMTSAFFPSDEGSGETARARFSATADRADVAALRAALENAKVPAPAKDYVLAQAALVGPELEPPPGVVQALQKLALHGLVDVETATRH